MGKKGRIATAILLAAALAGLVWHFVPSREPVYQGKPLQFYLDQLATHYPQRSADDPNIKAIHAMGPEVIPHLRRAFRRKHSTFLKAVVFLRAELPNAIARRLPDPKSEIYLQGLSAASAHALATFGPLASEAVPDLIEGLNDVTTASMAIYAIMEIGPEPQHLPAFLALLNSTNRWGPAYAFNCIGRIGVITPQVFSALTNAAAGDNAYSRPIAISALGQLGPKAQSAVLVLTNNLTDPDARIRTASIGALWRIHKNTNAAIAWLTNALDQELNQQPPRPNTRNSLGTREINLLSMVALLKDIGAHAQPAAPWLRVMRKERDIRVRANAAEALWKIASENSGVGVWLEALSHSDPNVRVYAVRLLSDFCIEARMDRPEFEEMLNSQDSFIRFYSARALWKLKGEAERALPELIAGLNDHFTYYQNAQIRQTAAETLGDMGAQARPAIPDLLLALNDGVAGVRTAATNALRKIDPEAAMKAGVK